ncbi:hypothetical protein [Niveibacterium sp. COAC-50]|uniref:hypothetical protein n=1 Tax=Niveibacterium sp. COAC-50 TaxID=2729384 RepID=UPI0015541981|nr:hypothetical protein [Niveibacterium sp. COAC-50]
MEYGEFNVIPKHKQIAAEAIRAFEAVFVGWKFPGQRTTELYLKLWTRICKAGGLPQKLSTVRSKRYFYQLRAAAIYVCVNRMLELLTRLMGVNFGMPAETVERIASELLAEVDVLKALEPDYLRTRYKHKTGSLWKRHVAKNKTSPSPGRSKRKSIVGLTYDDLLRLWELSSGSLYRDALAVSLATGCRPREIALGVGVNGGGGARLMIQILGAKLTDRTGARMRRLGYHGDETPWLTHLTELARSGVNQVTFDRQQQAKYFSTTVGRWSDRLWPERKVNRVTPYSLRHLMFSQFKQIEGRGWELVPAAFGQRSAASPSHYARGSGSVVGLLPVPLRVETSNPPAKRIKKAPPELRSSTDWSDGPT